MQKSESIKELAVALAKAQAAMAFAKKDANNPFFKSKYADFSSVVEAVKDPLTSHGISYLQFPLKNEKGEVGVETMLIHESGEWILGDPFFVPIVKPDAQSCGSGLSYAKRYSLQAITGVPSDDDDGEAAVGRPQQQTRPAAKPRQQPNEDQRAMEIESTLQTAEHDIKRQSDPEGLKSEFARWYKWSKTVGEGPVKRVQAAYERRKAELDEKRKREIEKEGEVA